MGRKKMVGSQLLGVSPEKQQLAQVNAAAETSKQSLAALKLDIKEQEKIRSKILEDQFALTKSITGSHEKKAALEKQLATLLSKIESAIKLSSDEHKSVEDKHAQNVERLTIKIENKTSELNSLSTQIVQSMDKLKSVNDKIAEASKQKHDLELSLTSLNDLIAKSEHSLEEKSLEHKQVKSALELSLGLVASSIKEEAAMASKITKLKSTVKDLETSISDGEGKVADLKSQAKTIEQQIAASEKKLKESDAQIMSISRREEQVGKVEKILSKQAQRLGINIKLD